MSMKDFYATCTQTSLPGPSVTCHYSSRDLFRLGPATPLSNLMGAVEAGWPAGWLAGPLTSHLTAAAIGSWRGITHPASHLIQRASFFRLLSCHLITLPPGELTGRGGGGQTRLEREDNDMTSVSSLTKWGRKQWKDIRCSVNGCQHEAHPYIHTAREP